MALPLRIWWSDEWWQLISWDILRYPEAWHMFGIASWTTCPCLTVCAAFAQVRRSTVAITCASRGQPFGSAWTINIEEVRYISPNSVLCATTGIYVCGGFNGTAATPRAEFLDLQATIIETALDVHFFLVVTKRQTRQIMNHAKTSWTDKMVLICLHYFDDFHNVCCSNTVLIVVTVVTSFTSPSNTAV